jgi:DNA-binding LacI/PurR family transcriptional regulator
LIDRTLPGVDTDFVGVQNYRAMFDATKYLVGLGHSRIAYVTRPEPINPVQDRLRGYLGAMQEAAHHNDYYEMVLSSPAVGTKWPALDAVFGQDSNKRPTAAVCVNDYEAVRFAERLTAIGLRIPDDISIVGYDNIVEKLPGGAGLTTIAQPFEEIGREAIRLFLRRIDNMDSASTYVELPSQLIVRESAIALHPAKA